MVRARFLMLTDVYDRAVTGEKMDEKKYDFKVIPEITEKMCKEYDLWPAGAIAKSSFVPESNDQADRIFRAGWDLLVECGQYNIDTNRIVKVADDEVREGLKRCPKELWLGGPGGKDAAHMIPRKVDGVNYEVKPLTQGGPTGAPITEPVFIKLMQSYAQEACVDTIVDGVLNTIEGVPGLPETPREVKAVMSEVTWIRIACMEAGRSGMAI